MRLYLLVGVVMLFVLLSFGLQTNAEDALLEDQEVVSAVTWMHSNGMTKYPMVEEFRPNDYLTRQEAAKFFSEFAINILYEVIDQNKFCGFDDLESADPSLVNHILSSCLLGLFQGTAGYFKPDEYFTKAQALAVLVRSLDDYRNEETVPWWINYYRKAEELGLTREKDPYALDRPLKRYEMALLLYRAVNKDISMDQIVGHDTATGKDHAVAGADSNTVKVEELIKTGGDGE